MVRDESFSLQELLRAEDLMRRDLGRRLHDGFAQDLAAMLLIAEGLANVGGADRREEFEDMLNAGRRCVREARVLSTFLAPRILDGDLAGTINAFFGGLNRAGTCKTSLTIQATPPPELGCTAEIFRCLQEAVDLVVRCDKSREIEVTMRRSNQNFEIRLEDDSGTQEAGSEALRKRKPWFEAQVHLAGGEVELPVDGSTRIILHFPIPKKDQGTP